MSKSNKKRDPVYHIYWPVTRNGTNPPFGSGLNVLHDSKGNEVPRRFRVSMLVKGRTLEGWDHEDEQVISAIKELMTYSELQELIKATCTEFVNRDWSGYLDKPKITGKATVRLR